MTKQDEKLRFHEDRLRKPLEEVRRSAAINSAAPTTGYGAIDARIQSRVSAANEKALRTAREVLTSAANSVVEELLGEDVVNGPAYVKHVVDAVKDLPNCLAAIEQQLSVLRWWLGAQGDASQGVPVPHAPFENPANAGKTRVT